MWDVLSLSKGDYPSERHDGRPWHPTEDKTRHGKSGQYDFRACLLQCRGDWQWFKALFGFKGWASANICWRCRANRSDVPFTDPSPNALWRFHRIHTSEFNYLCELNGYDISPLFAIPFFTVENICIDVLHDCDLGFTQEVLGSVMFGGLGKFATGKNRKEQVADLQQKMKDHYKRLGTPNKINALTQEMIKQKGKAPKLRAKGAETRHLVPFGLEIATALHAAEESAHTLTVLKCISALFDFYMCLGVSPFPKEEAQRAVRNCCIFSNLCMTKLNRTARRPGG